MNSRKATKTQSKQETKTRKSQSMEQFEKKVPSGKENKKQRKSQTKIKELDEEKSKKKTKKAEEDEAEKVKEEFPNAAILDITSKSNMRYAQILSPFYPHMNIPIPFTEGLTATCVEAVWLILIYIRLCIIIRNGPGFHNHHVWLQLRT